MRVSAAIAAVICVIALSPASAGAQTPSPPVPDVPTPAPPTATPPAPEVPKVEVPSRPSWGSLEEPPAVEQPAPDATRGQNDAPPPPEPDAQNTIWWDVGYRYPGSYSTTRLLSLMGAIERKTDAKRALRAAAPFIVAGRARFWDSWGEVRHADAGLRPHLGQDVFCDHGAAVLASDHGDLEYGQDASGGLVARVHRGDGSYWYYAHLSRFASARSSGDRVTPGDVIGYCGTSGNAAGTPPHVHFSFFVNHVAQNPMGALIGWLGDAEARAERVLEKVTRRRRVKPEPTLKEPLVETLFARPAFRCLPPVAEELLELVMPGRM